MDAIDRSTSTVFRHEDVKGSKMWRNNGKGLIMNSKMEDLKCKSFSSRALDNLVSIKCDRVGNDVVLSNLNCLKY